MAQYSNMTAIAWERNCSFKEKPMKAYLYTDQLKNIIIQTGILVLVVTLPIEVHSAKDSEVLCLSYCYCLIRKLIQQLTQFLVTQCHQS